jgi:hypothetical protein
VAVRKRFLASNGREVDKIVTDGGVTGYIDSTIPIDALLAIQKRLAAKLKRWHAERRRLARQELRRSREPGLTPLNSRRPLRTLMVKRRNDEVA